MKGVKNFIYSTIIAATTLFNSCEKPEDFKKLPEETPAEQPADNPSNNGLYDNAYVFEDSDLEKVISYDYFTIGFSSPQEFSVGDIISGGISEKTPYGFLHKITRVTPDKKSFKVDLNTSLDEAVKNGEGSFSKNWTYNDLKSASYNPNISLQSGNSSYNFHLNVNEIIYDADGNPNTTLDQMVLKGYSDFNIITDLKTKITDGKVYAKFENEINGKSSFQLVTDMELLNINKKIPLHQYYFNPIVFSVGPVPVVILPKASLNFYLDANLNSKIDAEFSNKFSYRNILELEDGNWTLTKDTSNFFDTTIPKTKIDFNATASASLSPEVSLELYGLAGPYANLKLGTTFDANTENNPWWTWSIWANANIGFDISKISKNAENFEKTIPLLEDIIIKQAAGPFPGSGEGEGGEDSEIGTLYDARDGQTYKTVKIGDQQWMAENLNYSHENSNYYEEDSSYAQNYGRLYGWDGAHEGCPLGWKLPTREDWEVLFEYIGNPFGGKIKAIGTVEDETGLWEFPNTGATNETGFTALPGGRKNERGYNGEGRHAYFWESYPDALRAYYFDYNGEYYGTISTPFTMNLKNDMKKAIKYSVRCIKD